MSDSSPSLSSFEKNVNTRDQATSTFEDQSSQPLDSSSPVESVFSPSPPPPPPPRDRPPALLKPKLKLTSLAPRNISPIPEGSKSNESSHPRRSSVVSDPDAITVDAFRPWKMILIFSSHWMFSAAIFFAGLVLALAPPREDRACHLYFVVVYLRMAYWIVTYVQHEKIKPSCQKLVNQNFNLYRDMACYRKAPLQIVSIWNTVLMAVQSYVRTLFVAHEHDANICSGIDEEEQITPQLFIVIFCGLETITLGCFYLPAILRLIRSMQPQEEDSPNRTLSNLDDIPINQRLMRQAEQVKILRVTNTRLRMEALSLGALD